MADEGNESRSRRMDLNLYLGLPRSPRPRSLDLGSDLALSSLPLSSSSTAGDSRAPADMSGSVEQQLDSHPPYSPSHAAYTPDQPLVHPLNPADGNAIPEYAPYYPSYETFGPPYPPIPPIMPEPEGADAPYSPSRVQLLPTVQETDEPAVQDVDSHLPYDPPFPPGLADEPVNLGGESHAPYSPPYIPELAVPRGHDEGTFGFLPPIPLQTGELLGRQGGSSSQHDFIRSPEIRFRRLIESTHRWPTRRFRSSLPYVGERSNFGSPSSPSPEQLIHDTMNSQRSSESSGKNKVSAEGIVAEASEEETEEKSRNAANFECNICLDMATEPVVTSCGHLFCWPCLYQWLHVHSEHKECPVCKGEVIESNITPIYGRGSSETSAEKKLGEYGESGLKIPPRPRGNRLESLRQQFRPMSRRLGEGIATSWRRLLDHQMRGGNRFEGNADPSLQEIFNGAHRRALARLRARRLQREEGDPESRSLAADEIGLPRNSTSNPFSSNTSSIFQDGIDLWRRFSLYGLTSTERLAAITADVGRVVGRFTTSGNNRYGASSSSINPPNPEPPVSGHHVGAALATDQASASSTMAVIQGDVATSEAPAEPNSAGSSRSHRRRGRSSTSSSLDVDGGALHARKRRRLN
ncbi:E3 ubiquitin-protein ligase RNF5 [Cocos nucifera]|uniref:E3 ubiquitin-protein ligase RMA n=1 Tax=Cocos nucifera TaxID=13894 RepID=A0A8K0ILN6_COCNU|nr:E3 ubiquitin-protein ligase RNF5 [Cocos nucifera]